MPQPLHTTPIEQFHNPRVALNQGSVKSVATAFVYSFAAVLLVPHVRFWPYLPVRGNTLVELSQGYEWRVTARIRT